MQSGSLLTSPEAGALEYDGQVFYGTPVVSNPGIMRAEMFCTNTSNRTFTNNQSGQAMFTSPTNGALDVLAGTTYYFRCHFDIHGMNTITNGGFAFVIAGTATFSSAAYFTECNRISTVDTTASATEVSHQTSTGQSQPLTALSTGNATAGGILRGILRCNGSGTLIPQLRQVNASSAMVLQADSYFKIFAIGTDTVVDIGNWS
jgi:hypothetical protein